MKKEHHFTSPRNLFEKLLRDSDKYTQEPNGDNFFNFIATAYHLQEWIKKSPIASHETTKRLLKKVSHNSTIQYCCEIIEGSKGYVFEIGDNNSTTLFVEDEQYNPSEIIDEVLNLYKEYFEIK